MSKSTKKLLGIKPNKYRVIDHWIPVPITDRNLECIPVLELSLKEIWEYYLKDNCESIPNYEKFLCLVTQSLQTTGPKEELFFEFSDSFYFKVDNFKEALIEAMTEKRKRRMAA